MSDLPDAEEEAEAVARAFHETYERLAEAHGYETRAESAVPWDEVPEANRDLMVAVALDLLSRGAIDPGPLTLEELAEVDPL